PKVAWCLSDIRPRLERTVRACILALGYHREPLHDWPLRSLPALQHRSLHADGAKARGAPVTRNSEQRKLAADPAELFSISCEGIKQRCPCTSPFESSGILGPFSRCTTFWIEANGSRVNN